MEKRSFLGIPYPVMKQPKGYFYSQSGTDQIKADLLCLLLTNPGERVFLPSFGTPLERLLFDPSDITLYERARNMIINSIKTWEPRIKIEDIIIGGVSSESTLNPLDDKTQTDHILSIVIRFIDPQEIKEIQELVLEIPLAS